MAEKDSCVGKGSWALITYLFRFPLIVPFLWLCSLFLSREPVLNSGLDACCLKISTQKTSHSGKGIFPFLGNPATWDNGGLMSQEPSSLSRVKGKAWKRGRGYVREKQVPRQVFLCLHDPEQTC